MKKNFFLLLLLLPAYLFAQEKDYFKKDASDFLNGYSNNALFVEAGGNAFVVFSLNYDNIFYRKENKSWSGRIGLNPGIGLDDNSFTIPVTVSYLMGRIVSFETGAGANLLFTRNRSSIFLTGIIGVRYQKRNRVFVKAAATPFFVRNPKYFVGDGNVIFWLGLSLGYGF